MSTVHTDTESSRALIENGMSNYYETVDWLTKLCVVPGLFFNVLLIVLVTKYSRSDIGTFKWLLKIFAFYDIILTILHSIFDPKCFTLPGVFSCVLDFPYGNQYLTAFHFILFMNSYAILLTHLLYRYWAIRKPHKIVLFSKPMFVLKLVSLVLAMDVLLMLLSFGVINDEGSFITQRMIKEFQQRYNRTRETGWIIAEMFPTGESNFGAIGVSFFFDIVGTGIVVAVITLAYLTYSHISTAFALAPAARAAQMVLLKMVCVQTFIPMVCVMIPYFINLTLPIFGITIPAISDVTGMIMAFFPSWDPLAVIVLMKPYRVGLWMMITGRKHVDVKIVSQMTQIS